MILQALAAYYDRLRGGGTLQPRGFQEKEIPWVVELSPEGRFLRLIPTGGEDGRGRKFVVPAEVKKSVNIAANLMWGNAEYVLGWPRPNLNEKQAAKVPQRHEAFIARLRALPEAAQADPGVSAVTRFLETNDFSAVQRTDGWEELKRGNGNISFRLEGDGDLVCERPAVKAVLRESACQAKGTDNDEQGWCLVTGQRASVARLHPSIKGVRGAQTSGANLVSFNRDAFSSHGWSQGANAPISETAAHAYTTALNHLLSRGNDRHRFIEGDTTFVFWAAEARPIQDQFAHLLGSYAVEQRESDGTPVRDTFESVRRGLRPSLEDQTPFYVLGLAPNAARLAVRLWHEGTVAELAHNILGHFDDLEIVGLGGESNVPGLWRLIGSAARDGDPGKLSNTLRGQLAAGVMDAILRGQPYPTTLLARAIARCRAEARRKPERDSFRLMLPIRAALIKASLKRRSPTKEVSVSLDLRERDVGYRLGRLFAVLEGIQQASTRVDSQRRNGTENDDGSSHHAQLNVTIRDRYFSAFMITPRSVIVQLERLKNAHLKKVRRSAPKLARYFDHQVNLILDPLSSKEGFPASLSLQEQGRFILGYHHQRNSRRDRGGDQAEREPDDLSEAETTQ
jgi:CRISPR-associated protein Csd1